MAAEKEGRAWFTEDESIFSLIPYVARGWYPRGEKVKAKMTFSRKRFYAFGAGNGRKEYFRFFDGEKKRIDARMTIQFLSYLHKKHAKLLLIWDKAPSHTCKKVREYAHSRDIQLEFLPTADPEDNPMEGAWDYLKGETANDYYEKIDDYKKAVRKTRREKNLTKIYKYLLP